jgi:hypothetical protein
MALSLQRASVPLFSGWQSLAFSSVPASTHQPLLGFNGLYSLHRPLLDHTGLFSHLGGRGQAQASGVPHVKEPSRSRGMPSEAAAPAAASSAANNAVSGVLSNFPNVVNAGKALPVPIHDVQHHIRTSGPAITSRFQRLEGAKLEAVRQEFKAMEQDGIIQRSTSPWASPQHMVPMKGGTRRPCEDFQRLNLVTEPDMYTLPNMLDFADRFSGCRIFSKIDLQKGY